MKLTAKGRYAVMAVADIAAQGDGACVPISAVAERQGISSAYLEQLLVKLRRADIVESARGTKGGYSLTARPEDIDISRIIAAVDEDIKAHGCTPEAKIACTGRSDKCLTHNLWGALEAHIEDFLAGVSVRDVIDQTIPKITAEAAQ